MSETRITLTESQFRSLVKSIWDEAFSEGWHDGVGMQNESVSQHAESRFWLSNAETTVNKLIELEMTNETPNKSTQDAEDRALEALIVQRLRGDGDLPQLSDEERAAMNSLRPDFIPRLIESVDRAEPTAADVCSIDPAEHAADCIEGYLRFGCRLRIPEFLEEWHQRIVGMVRKAIERSGK